LNKVRTINDINSNNNNTSDETLTYAKEEVAGLTTEDLGKETDEDPNHVRKKYLDPLITLGLVQKTPSVKDGRTNIYFLPDNIQNKDNNKDKDKIIIRNPDLYPTKNVSLNLLERS
jgi:hypothetical protein